MAEWQAYSCDAITGVQIDRIPFSAFQYERLLSAGGTGSVTVPLDGSFEKSQLVSLLQEWSRIIVVERDGAVEYMGYVLGDRYARGQSSVTVSLGDVWSMFGRRFAVDHTVSGVEKWKTTVTGNLAYQAAQAVLRGRSGVGSPNSQFPVTIPGFTGGTSVSRTYYGYHLDYVSDVLDDLMEEGLDLFFDPSWISSGAASWLMRGGPAWSSGVTREFFVTADRSEVVGFSAVSDAARVTNNADRIGEGSEQDMLVRSFRNPDSPYPLLELASESKSVSDVNQLTALAIQDLSTFGSPTSQWEMSVSADNPVDVGDTVRIHFDGDPWIADGWHSRRVVKVGVSLPGPDVKTVGLQATGGA